MVACSILSCSSELPRESNFDSSSKSYLISFEASNDRISACFSCVNKPIKVKGLRIKFAVPYADIERVIDRPIDKETGFFIFRLIDKEIQLGIITMNTFESLKNESDIPLHF